MYLRETQNFTGKRLNVHSNLCSIANPLRELVPKIVAGISKQLKEKSLKVRSGAFTLLKELVTVLKGSLNDHIGAIVPGLQHSLGVFLKHYINAHIIQGQEYKLNLEDRRPCIP